MLTPTVGSTLTTLNSQENPDVEVEPHSGQKFKHENFERELGYYAHIKAIDLGPEETYHFSFNPHSGKVFFHLGPNYWVELNFKEIEQSTGSKGVFYYKEKRPGQTPGEWGFPCDNMGMRARLENIIAEANKPSGEEEIFDPIPTLSLIPGEEYAKFLTSAPLAQRVVKKIFNLKFFMLVSSIILGLVGAPLLVSSGLRALPQYFFFLGTGICTLALIFLMVAGVKHCCVERDGTFC
jgi:hypothetical protein